MNSQKKFTFLFETIRLTDGVPQNLKFHLWRMIYSLKSAPKFNLLDILKTNQPGLVRAKVIYHKNGELVKVEFHPYKMREFSEFTLVSTNINYDKKYLIRDEIDALKADFDEIIMIKNNLATDTSIANIAIFKDSAWLTPKSPLLKGTTRERLLKSGFLKEADIDMDMLLTAKKFAIMNAMMDFYEVKDFKFIC